MPVMFHVAAGYLADTIDREGLTPRTPEGGSFPQGVYLFYDQANAEFFCAHMTERDQDEYGPGEPERVIYQVRLDDGCDLHRDPAVTDEDAFQAEYPVQPLRAAYITGPVAPDRLTRL